MNLLLGGLSGALYGAVHGISFAVSYIIGLILGVAVAVEAWAISLVLQLSINLPNSPPVQFGVPVTTYIANLGFVIAIVVIAIMTILRRESYGLKQTIAKLVLGAILVNFSLIIAGTILNFSDQLTFAFLNQVDPGAEEGSFNSLATSLAGAFSPHKFYLPSGDGGFANPAAGLEHGAGGAVSGLASNVGAMFMPLVSVIFTAFALLFIVIVLGALAVMLLIRYVYIAGLMIFMPLAWVAWIFPVTRHHFSDWWSKFFKQVFFAPIVVFSIWLTIKTGEIMGREGYGAAAYMSANPIGDALGSFLAPVVRQMLDAIVLCGILLMGIFAANKLGAHGAGAAVTAAKVIGKGAGSYVRNRGIQAGTSFLRRPSGQEGKSRAERVATWAAKQPTRVGRFFGGYAAQGVAAVAAQGTGLVKDYEKEAGGMTTDQLVAAATTGPAYKRIAAMNELVKKGQINKLTPEITHAKEAKDAFERFGQGKAYSDLEKTAGFTLETYQVSKKGDAALFTKEGVENAEKFVASLNKSDVSKKMQVDDLIKEHPALFKNLVLGALEKPELLSSVIAKVKFGNIKKVEQTLNDLEKDITLIADSEKRLSKQKSIESARGKLEKIMAHNLYTIDIPTEPTPAPSPPPQPKTP